MRAPEGSLFAFLRDWGWPFDETDEDVRVEGSGYVFWSREAGFAEGQTLVFRFEEDALELAPDANHPERRLVLTPADVDGLRGPLSAYLAGETDHAAYMRAHPAAKAILALFCEARAEADAAEAARLSEAPPE